jgi:hypothetical protein
VTLRHDFGFLEGHDWDYDWNLGRNDAVNALKFDRMNRIDRMEEQIAMRNRF